MSAHNLPAELANAQHEMPVKIGYIPGKGYTYGAGTDLPGASDKTWAKGALFMKIDAAADTNLYINEAASGMGTTPSWVAIATP